MIVSISYGFVYEFKAKNGFDRDVDFSRFENSLLVIFISNKEFKTNSELLKLNKIYNKYKTKNVSFVGFAIKETSLMQDGFCVINYGVDFEMIGDRNNKLSKLKKYIFHIYGNENLDLYSPILIHERKIIRLSSISQLEKGLEEILK